MCDIRQMAAYKVVLSHYWEKDKLLGVGTYGQIRLAVHEIVNEKVAVKIIEKRHLTTNWDLHAIQNEINLLRYVIHPNVIHLYEILETKIKLYLVMEYANQGSLLTQLQSFTKFSEAQSLLYLRQIVEALHALHSKNLYHGNLRLENILIKDDTVKLANFGSCPFGNSKLISTPAEMEDERVRYEKLNEDILNLAVIFYFMLTGCPHPANKKYADLIPKIKYGLYNKVYGISERSLLLLERLLQKTSIEWIRQDINQTEQIENLAIDEIQIMNELSRLGLDINDLMEQLRIKKHNTLTTCYYLVRAKLSKKLKTRMKANQPLENRKEEIAKKLKNTLQLKSYKQVRLDTEVENSPDRRSRDKRIHSVVQPAISKLNRSEDLTTNKKMMKILQNDNFVIIIKRKKH